MNRDTKMELMIESSSENEGLARTCVAAFVTRLDPTMEEMADIKTAVSEAVTNCIIHGYEQQKGMIHIRCQISGRKVRVEAEHAGVGIRDIRQAMEPLYTSKPELERSGMGFSFMQAFMDELAVTSEPGCGTRVVMEKEIGKAGLYGHSGTD